MGRSVLPQSKKSAAPKRLITLAILTLFLLLYALSEPFQIVLLSKIFPHAPQYTHSRKTILEMVTVHLAITIGATLLSTIMGIVIGILVTRDFGYAWQRLVLRLNAFVQTFPPSAVIIMAFPLLGFGWKPALLALFLYSLFPILSNTIVGFEAIDQAVIDAAKGLGMDKWQRLFIVELPQALPFIFTGVRHSYILNLSTAAIAAVIGGGGVGTIIISGLTLRNSALVFSGTLVISLMALIGEQLFYLFSRRKRPHSPSSASDRVF